MREENATALSQIWCRLLFEDKYMPVWVDAVYLHGLSAGMVASCGLFDLIARFVVSGAANRVAFNGSDGRGMPPQDRPGAAWPGSGWYRQELCRRGVPSAMLMPTRDGLHTRDECDALVELAKTHRWKAVVDVTVPYHWPRVIASMVGAMERAQYRFKIHFLRPIGVQWHRHMAGSQSIKKNSSFLEETADDVLRLFKYWDKGRENDAWRSAWGAPQEEILRYLDWRDRGGLILGY